MSDQPQKGRYLKSRSTSVSLRVRNLSPLIGDLLHGMTLQAEASAQPQKRPLFEQVVLENLHLLSKNKPENTADLVTAIKQKLQISGFLVLPQDEGRIRAIAHEIDNPLEKLTDLKLEDLPQKVIDQLDLTPPEPPQPEGVAESPATPPIPPETAQQASQQRLDQLTQLKKLFPPRQTKDLKTIDQGLTALDKLDDQLHPATKTLLQGIRPEDLGQVQQTLETTFKKVGLNPAEHPVVQTVVGAKEQLENFVSLKSELANTIQVLRTPDRLSGWVNAANLNKSLRLPQWLGVSIEKAALTETGTLQLTASVSQTTKLAKTLKPLAKIGNKLGVQLGKTAVGQAAKKAVAAAATKLGIKATVGTVTATIPGGQIVTAILAANAALDAAEKIPVIGGVVHFFREMTPWRASIRTVKKTVSDVRGAVSGDKEAAGRVALKGAAILGLTTAGIIATRRITRRFRRRLRRSWGSPGRFILLTIRDRRRRRRKRRRRIIIGMTLLVILIALIIVVMLAGGAFMVEPALISEVATNATSSYISVSKTANPTAIANPTGAVSIDYTITITALTGKLSNVLVQNNTRIRNPETGATFPITLDINGDPITVWNIDEVTGSYNINYTVLLSVDKIDGIGNLTQIHDTHLIDTVNVSADISSAGVTGDQVGTTVFVRIGDPKALIPSGWPATGTLTQGPGGSFSHLFLNAIDIGNKDNPGPIYATHDGIATCTNSTSTSGYGTNVVVSAPTGFITIYGHLEYLTCNSVHNQMVTAGTQIGIMDNTGYSTGNHLHYELRGDPGLGTDINLYLPFPVPPEGDGYVTSSY